MASLEAALADIVGVAHATVDPDLLASYQTDWTGRYQGLARAVVCPGSTEEVAAVVARCREDGAAVTVQGGNTGLVGASTPLGGEVLLSTRRMDQVRLDSTTMVAGSGATLERVRALASAAGARFPLDLASRSSATIGGMVATNARGAFGARYGPMGEQVTGVVAVTGRGDVVDELDDGGLLTAEMIGSEGALAVVTGVRLHLVEPKGPTATALVAVSGAGEAAERVAAVDDVEAAELLWHDAAEVTAKQLGTTIPLAAAPAYLLVEVAGSADDLGPVVDGLPTDLIAVGFGGDRRRLWELREHCTESVNRLGVPHKVDVSVPRAAMDAFLAEVDGRLKAVAPGAAVLVFGHLLHDDLHVNVVGPDPADDSVDEAILEIAMAAGGSARGEHGWGRTKVRWMPAEEQTRWRARKARYDPDGLLNPEVLLSREEGP